MVHLSTRLAAAALFTASLFASSSATAQDTLFLRNGRSVVVNVEEIGLDDIKYREPGSELRVSVEKDQVSRVAMHDGKVVRIDRDPLDTRFSEKVMAKHHVIKAEFLSLAFDHFTMGYEQVLKPWMNIEARAGIIGVGNAKFGDDSKGMLVAVGFKFISRPDIMTRGMRLGHPLAGRYVKPELIFNTFTTTYRNETGYYDYTLNRYITTSSTNDVRYTNVAFNLVIGKQRFLGNGVTFDTWVGIGYGFQSNDADDEEQKAYCYTHTMLGRTMPIILSGGMTLGVAF